MTSGGVRVTELADSDWQAHYFAAFPRVANWIADPVSTLSDQIPSIPCIDIDAVAHADPISPVTVGERLVALIPNARLCIFQVQITTLLKRSSKLSLPT
jgi:hypothetical protein